MSFAVTKLLSLLAYPLSQSILLLLLALLLRLFHRSGTLLVMLAAGWLWLCSTAWFADHAMATLETSQPPKAISKLPQAGAIVVLGGATRGDVHMGSLGDLNAQADRLLHAAAIYKADKAPWVLVSGGAAQDARPEAELMRDILAVMGVPGKQVITESISRDTRENALYSRQLLEQRNIDSIILVTSAFHMRRSRALFESQGFTVYPASTDYQRLVSEPSVPRWLPTVEDLQRTTWALREHVGWYYYRFQGWL